MYKRILILYLLISPFLFCLHSNANAGISDAADYLEIAQNEDGSWGSDYPSMFFETAEVTRILGEVGITGDAYQEGIDFIKDESIESIEDYALKISGILPAGEDVTDELDLIIEAQNDDGGWGFDFGYNSDVYHNALVLQALKAAGINDNDMIGSALTFLSDQQNSDGGFGFADDESSIFYSSIIIIALTEYKTEYQSLQTNIDLASSYLLTQKNPDGSYGTEDNKIFETALACRALVAAGEYFETLAIKDYLLNTQNPNGSWEDEAYSTALALWALKETEDIDKPNLRVLDSHISISPLYPVEGQTVTVGCTVLNTGTIAAADVAVNFYLGDPASTGELIGSNTIPLIESSGSGYTEITWVLDEAGDRDIYVFADPENVVDEVSEEDNITSVSITAASNPDLAIESSDISFDNTSPLEGEYFTLTANIHNLGEGAIGHVTVAVYDGDPQGSGTKLTELTFNSIPGGSAGTALFDLALSAGTYDLHVFIDPDNNIDEASEGNNIASRTMTVGSGGVEGIDLAVVPGEISFSTPYPREGDTITITSLIRNNGDQNADSATVVFYDGDPGSGGTSLGSPFTGVVIPAGGVATLNLNTASLVSGAHEIYVVADPDDTIEETDELNNTAHRPLTVLPQDSIIDLAVTADNISFEPQDPDAGEVVQITCGVTNESTVSVQNIKVRIYEGDPDAGGTLLLPEVIIPQLGSGSTGWITVERDTTGWGGNHEIVVVVDPEEEVQEEYEDNNRASRTLTVTSLNVIDLVVVTGGISVDPSAPTVYDDMTISCLVENTGSEDIAEADSAFYDGDPDTGGELLGIVTLENFAAGGTASVGITLPGSMLAGTHTIHVVADPSKIIAEINEYNNRAEQEITVSAPDLAITEDDISFDPTEPVSGEPFTMTATVHNNGTLDSGPVTVSVYDGDPDAGGTLLSEVILSQVSAGGNSPAVFELILTSGSYNLYVSVDPQNGVPEADEGNNLAMHSITVTPAYECSDGETRSCTSDCGEGVETCSGGFWQDCVPIDPPEEICDGVDNDCDGEIDEGVMGTYCLDADNDTYGDPAESVQACEAPEGYVEDSSDCDDTDPAVNPGAEEIPNNGKDDDCNHDTPDGNKKDQAVACGAEWLKTHQSEQGGWAGPGGEFDQIATSLETAMALRAIAVSGKTGIPEFNLIKDRLFSLQATNGSWDNNGYSTGESIMALIAASEAPESEVIQNAVSWVKLHQEDDGSFDKDPWLTGLSIKALIDAGEDKGSNCIQSAKQWLIDYQNPDGYWGLKSYALDYSTPYVRYYPVVGLVLASSSPPNQTEEEAINKAADWYHSYYHDDYRNVTFYLYSLINILRYTNKYPEDIPSIADDLKNQQQSDGGWVTHYYTHPYSDVRPTYESIIALSELKETGQPIDNGVQWISDHTNLLGDVVSPYEDSFDTATSCFALNVSDPDGSSPEIIEAFERIIETQQPNNTWTLKLTHTTPNDKGHTLSTAYILWALSSIDIDVAGKDAVVANAIGVIFGDQNIDGGWHRLLGYGDSSQLRTTCYCLLTLVSSGTDFGDYQISKLNKAINWLLHAGIASEEWADITNKSLAVLISEKLTGYQDKLDPAIMISYGELASDTIEWLKLNQNPDGGWGSMDSNVRDTSWVIIALSTTGNDGLETARGVQWLLSLQNDDCGWASLPGIPASAATYTAIATWALAVSEYEPEIDLELTFDKPYYYPGEKVTMTVNPLNADADDLSLTGTVKESVGAAYPITFNQDGNTFTGTHILSDNHLPGTDVVSIVATGDSGTGVVAGTFIVKNVEGVLPDLTISGITFSSNTPVEGEAVTINATVSNSEVRDAANVVVRCYDGDPDSGGTLIGEQTQGMIIGLGNAEVEFSWQAVSGTHEIYVVVDPDDTIPETDEDNNEAWANINVYVSGNNPPVITSSPIMSNICVRFAGFEEIQAIPTHHALEWESFTIDGETYLAVANWTEDDYTYNVDSMIYKWNGTSFDEFQAIPASGGSDFEKFDIDGETYLAVANHYNGGTKIYKWNGSLFEENQVIQNGRARNCESFVIDDETYLAVAIAWDPSCGCYCDTIIYKWNGSSFEEFQSIPTYDSREWESFTIDGVPYLAVANAGCSTTDIVDSKIYQWNGSSFDEFQVFPSDAATHRWESFTIDGETYLAVANVLGPSKIYKWNGLLFEEYQVIPTNWTVDWEYFAIDGESYLARAIVGNGSTQNVNSMIYKWNGTSFEEVQAIPTSGAYEWESFTIDGETYLAVANYFNDFTFSIDSKIYKWGELIVDGLCHGDGTCDDNLECITTVTAIVGVKYEYDVEATDLNEDELIYTLTEFPDNMAIDESTGLIEWIPTVEQLGPHSVVIEVSDGRGGTDTQSFTIIVIEEGILPDVSIESGDIAFSTNTPLEGEIITITATMRNLGMSDADDIIVRFLDGTIQIGEEQIISTLSPGSSEVVEVTWDTLGEQERNYIHVVVDPDNSIEEANELNNEAIKIIDVDEPGLPDLAISDADISLVPADPLEGDTVTISATIHNRGEPVDGSKVSFYDGDPDNGGTLIEDEIIYSTILFGESEILEVDWETVGTAEEHEIYVVVDPEDVITEENEGNNRASSLISVESSQLAIEVSLDKGQYEVDEDVSISTHITNLSSEQRVTTLDLLVIDTAGNTISELVVSEAIPLDPTGDATRNMIWNAGSKRAGEYSIVGIVKENGIPRAMDRAGFIIIADLNLSAEVTTDKMAYISYQQEKITSLIRSFSPNHTFSDLNAEITVKDSSDEILYSEDKLIDTLFPLGSDQWIIYWGTQIYPPGEYTVELKVADGGTIEVSDLTLFSILPSYEGEMALRGSLTIDPAEVNRGEEVLLSYEVENIGNVDFLEVNLLLQVVQVDTQDFIADLNDHCSLNLGESCSGTQTLSTGGMPAADCMIVLLGEVVGMSQTIAFAPLTVINQCPVAEGGEDRLVVIGETVVLDGSGSFDPDGVEVTYSWSIVEKPEGSSTELSTPDEYNPDLTPDVHGDYRIQLIVSDGLCESEPDVVLVTTENRPPVADAGDDQEVNVGDTIYLDGGGSIDPDGDTIESYQWIMVSTPDGSAAELSDSQIVVPSFTADMAGEYIIELTVSDWELASEPDQVTITSNQCPIAGAGEDQTALVGEEVELDGSLSHDPDNDFITYAWSFVDIPEGSEAALSDPTEVNPTFTPDLEGDYSVQLIVSDGLCESEADTVIITVEHSVTPPPGLIEEAIYLEDEAIEMLYDSGDLQEARTKIESSITKLQETIDLIESGSFVGECGMAVYIARWKLHLAIYFDERALQWIQEDSYWRRSAALFDLTIAKWYKQCALVILE